MVWLDMLSYSYCCEQDQLRLCVPNVHRCRNSPWERSVWGWCRGHWNICKASWESDSLYCSIYTISVSVTVTISVNHLQTCWLLLLNYNPSRPPRRLQELPGTLVDSQHRNPPSGTPQSFSVPTSASWDTTELFTPGTPLHWDPRGLPSLGTPLYMTPECSSTPALLFTAFQIVPQPRHFSSNDSGYVLNAGTPLHRLGSFQSQNFFTSTVVSSTLALLLTRLRRASWPCEFSGSSTCRTCFSLAVSSFLHLCLVLWACCSTW